MKQKTAMMELNELVHSSISSDELGYWLFENIDKLLEKEKEQIMEAYTQGYWDDGHEDFTPDKYYNETYK